jgi:hypothetical protein
LQAISASRPDNIRGSLAGAGIRLKSQGHVAIFTACSIRRYRTDPETSLCHDKETPASNGGLLNTHKPSGTNRPLKILTLRF